MTRIWAAIVAAVTTAFLSTLAVLTVPAAAWAEQSGIAEELRRGPRFGFFGGAGVLCCLIVVGGIVAVIFLITRRRQ